MNTFPKCRRTRPAHPSTGNSVRVIVVAIIVGATVHLTAAATVDVTIIGLTFSPREVSIQPGDTVRWKWQANMPHTVTSGPPGQPDGKFGSPLGSSITYSHKFDEPGRFDYYCVPHADFGMNGTVFVAGATATLSAQPLNVSTRLRVQSGQNAMIGGFIVTGTAPKRVIVRGIGPSLAQANVAGVLANPTVELNGSSGAIGSNDNWRDSQQADIQASGVAPSNDAESAMIATLSPGNYTAIVEGKGGTSGVGLVEVYDLDQPADSKLANISTRGVVETGSNVMIGGFILGKGTEPARIIVRAIGPSLSGAGISGVLANPTLDLRDNNGELVRSNDNWKDSQQSEIQATGIPPSNDLESAIVATLPPGLHTAVVSGVGNTTGVGLVEVYQLP